MATANRRGHTRRTASGGTTTVRPTTFRYRAASQAASLWDRPGQRKRAMGLLLASGATSLAYAIVVAVWGVGEAVVVGSVTFVTVLLANDMRAARRAWKKRARYKGLRGRLHHNRQRLYAWRMTHLRDHPNQARMFERHVRRYQVTALGPAGPKGTPRARTTKTVRGKKAAAALEARARAGGWEPETLKVLDPMERVRS